MIESPTHLRIVTKPRLGLGERIVEAEEFIERALEEALQESSDLPEHLMTALRGAVFTGDKRVRPLLVRFIADYYGHGSEEIVSRYAAAVELVYCAAVVHDDLPMFDNAPRRRGKPSCHASYGTSTALLVGDALLTVAFDTLGNAPLEEAQLVLELTRMINEATGTLITGQSLELQNNIDIARFQRQKTAALFIAAAVGAARLGRAPRLELDHWRRFGDQLGQVLELHDELDDLCKADEQSGATAGVSDDPEAPRDALRQRLAAAVLGAYSVLEKFSGDVEPLYHVVGLVAGRYLPPDVVVPPTSLHQRCTA